MREPWWVQLKELIWQGPTPGQRRGLRQDAKDIVRFIVFETAFLFIVLYLAYLLGAR